MLESRALCVDGEAVPVKLLFMGWLFSGSSRLVCCYFWVCQVLCLGDARRVPCICHFLRVMGTRCCTAQKSNAYLCNDDLLSKLFQLPHLIVCVAAFLLGVSSAVCTRQPPTASVLAHLRLPAWSSVHAWLLRLWTGSGFAPERLPAPDPVLHVSAPVRRGAVADARLGLA